MADKNTIKNWFRTGLKPTQAQFWAFFDSVWFKDEKIPITAIDDIEGILNAKADAEVVNHHLTATDAHATEFGAKVDKVEGKALSTNDYTTGEKAKLVYLDTTKDVDKPVSTAQATADAVVLASAQTYSESLIAQLKGGAPLNYDTLGEIATELIALRSIVGGLSPDGDTVVNTINELMAVLTSYPEGTDLFALIQGKVAKTDIYNAFDCVVSGKVADARTVKTLNDALTALTTAVGNKVDKAAGERLINAGEITKLAGLTNCTTTVKTIVSTVLATQNVAGFVTYINNLAVVLVVGANEIVKYQTTDTGRVFELKLRGRSFGVGQAAIVATDVLEVTDFLNKDIKLLNYPSTRDDGPNPTNKVLSTDASGTLKMYSMTGFPAPYLSEVIPDSNLPSTTFNILMKGDFFTPNMTIAYAGQTVLSKTFISSKEYRITLTTGSVEGLYSITLNNGVSITYLNAFLVVLGSSYTPVIADFINVGSSVNVTDGTLTTKTPNATGSADLNLNFDMTKKWRLYFSIAQSPLIAEYYNVYYILKLTNQGVDFWKTRIETLSTATYLYQHYNDASGFIGGPVGSGSLPVNTTFSVFYEWDLVNMHIYYNNVKAYTFPASSFGASPFKVTFTLKDKDIKSIKYVLLPM